MQKVTFQCKRSGNFVSFTNENDVAGLRKHEGYNEVIEDKEVEALPVEKPLSLKKQKTVVPAFLQH
jgi:hypothetical protein